MGKFTMLFAGDYAPCRDYKRLVLDSGRQIFGDLQEDIADSDLSFLNLETPLCITGKPIIKSGPNIRSHPDSVLAVTGAGFDIIGLANNHIMDFDEEGLIETLSICQKMGLKVCGAGMNLEEAQKTLFVKTATQTIAFIALAEHEFCIAGPNKAGAAPLDPIDNTLQIIQALEQADLVFVTIHGGNEHFSFPRPGLRKLCRYYIDLGVDAVICHHAHVPGAYEMYNNKPIIYSLGNLIFDHKNPPVGWNEGYILKLSYNEITKSLSFDIIPYTQSVEQGGVRKMQSDQKEIFLNKLKEYNRILLNDDAYQNEWSSFCEKEKNWVLLSQYFPANTKFFNALSRVIKPQYLFLFSKKIQSSKLNGIRCESHLELLLEILQKIHAE